MPLPIPIDASFAPVRVVVASPAYYTGGPEALHQLAHALRGMGIDSCIHYYGCRNAAIEADFHRRYQTKAENAVPDDNTLLIIGEQEDPAVWRSAGWQRIAVWWLAAPRMFPLSRYEGCFHIFQSAYARDRRIAEGITGSLVSDYLREDLFPDAPPLLAGKYAKRTLIAINHRSAAWVGAAGIMELPRSPVRLLFNLSPERLADTLRRTRYFVDVGWHPGRDRMLREAAMLGATVLVGRQGAAAYAEDVPLPELLRIDETVPGALALKISELEAKTDETLRAMADYRLWIGRQKSAFLNEVAAWVQSPDGPWGRRQGPPSPLPAHDPIPVLERDLLQARMLLSSVGSRLLLQRQSSRPSGYLIRLERAAIRLLKSLRSR